MEIAFHNSAVNAELAFSPNATTRRTLRREPKEDAGINVAFESDDLGFVRETFFHCQSEYPAKSTDRLPTFYTVEALKAERTQLDRILGVLWSIVIYFNREWLIETLHGLIKKSSVELLEKYIVWLMGWPAGLKLNNNLDKFLGELFFWLLDLWNYFPIDKSTLSTLVHCVCVAGVASGFSLEVALLHDFLLLSSAHVLLFHRIAARLFNWQLRALVSLFHLFRGKKWNVLRVRLDSNNFDMDQLLLGTVLFTLLFFCFPTIAVYYYLFAASKLLITLVLFFVATTYRVVSASRDFPRYQVDSYFFQPLPSGSNFRLVFVKKPTVLKVINHANLKMFLPELARQLRSLVIPFCLI